MSKNATLSDVTPSATPSAAEIEQWRDLPRDEQLRRLRQELDHPDGDRIATSTMLDIREEGRALASKRRHG